MTTAGIPREEIGRSVIRPAIREDIEAIAEIYNESVVSSTASYDLGPQPLEARRLWFESHRRDGYPILVAEHPEDGVVGWSSLSAFHSRPAYRFTAEDSIYIGPAYRGGGLGKRLLVPLFDAAQEMGLHAVMALIDSRMEPSVRLHRSLGFETVGHLKQVGRKFDEWLDVIYMELILNSST